MKRSLLFLLICILLLAGETTLAQTASDYYLPLRVGNFLQFHTSETGAGSTWGARTTTQTIEGSDVISGRMYFREKDKDVMDGTLAAHVSNLFWIRKDSVGNVAVGAMSTTGSSNIDSASLVSGIVFRNEVLLKGFYRTYTYGTLTWQDSVLSVTETVSGAAGTFNNCLKISDTRFDSTGTVVYREYHYYAYGIGLVRIVRTLPVVAAHTDELLQYVATGVSDVAVNQNPETFSLAQNYPNPFNPSTTISYSLPTTTTVSLRIFNTLGQEVALLVNEQNSPGYYQMTWNASVSSGIYFYRLQAGEYVETKKMILLK